METTVDKLSSEEIFDYTCTVCLKKKRKSKPAQKFCRECRKYFCVVCLDQHNDYMDNHTLLDPTDQASAQTLVLLVDHCEAHPGKVLELFCEDHDEVVCNTCVSVEHRACDAILYIPTKAQSLLDDKELQEVNTRLKQTVVNLEKQRDRNLKQKEKLSTEESRHLSEIEEQQRKLIAMIVDRAESSKDEVRTTYKGFENKITECLTECNETQSKVQNCLKQIETYTVNNSQLFVVMKKGQKVLDMIENSSSTTGNQQVRYIPNHVESYLAGLRSLGSIQPQQLFKVTQKQEKSVMIRSDSETCSIADICRLTDGSLVLADWTNNRLKRLSSTSYKVTDHYDLHDHPGGVCCVNQQEVAVCLSNMIQFVSFGRKMKMTRQIYLDHHCSAIAFSKKKLFVTNGKETVYVYTLSGELLRTIGQTQSGQDMFTRSLAIAISDHGDRVYITDVDIGLICVDRQGRELYRYRGTHLKGGYGVCIDDQKNVIVIGYNSSNVVQLGEDGEELGEIVTQSDSLRRPLSVCFDRIERKIFVSKKRCDTIFIFDIEKY